MGAEHLANWAAKVEGAAGLWKADKGHRDEDKNFWLEQATETDTRGAKISQWAEWNKKRPPSAATVLFKIATSTKLFQLPDSLLGELPAQSFVAGSIGP